MADDVQQVISELDLSERLRFLMRLHGLTVQEFAEIAGVSKSAMEKYLAGPSSPRATALASICFGLGVNAQWLLFGTPDNDLLLIRDAVDDVIADILNELKQGGAIAEPFQRNQFGTKEWRVFTWELADQRAREAVERIQAAREKALTEAQQGMRTTAIGPFPLHHDNG